MITNSTKSVNLANNNIGIAGCNILLKYLLNLDSKLFLLLLIILFVDIRLEEINLENNHLGNEAGILLAKGM